MTLRTLLVASVLASALCRRATHGSAQAQLGEQQLATAEQGGEAGAALTGNPSFTGQHLAYMLGLASKPSPVPPVRPQAVRPQPVRPQSTSWWVFYRQNPVNFDGFKVGKHTEVVFCAVLRGLPSLAANRSGTKIPWEEANTVDPHVGPCWATAHPRHVPAQTRMRFPIAQFFGTGGPVEDIELYYAGQVTFSGKVGDVHQFVRAMRACGDWDFYNLLQWNCNHYADAVMLALHLPTTSFSIERLVQLPFQRDPGRYDVAKKTCVGEKCVSEKRVSNFPHTGHLASPALVCDKTVMQPVQAPVS